MELQQIEGREIINPTDKNHWLALRTRDITSTEVAALFHCSPYLTEFELWHRKKNPMVIEMEQNERMKWGSRLEHAIAAGIAQDNDWAIREMKEYIRDPELRLAASFDYSIEAKVVGDGEKVGFEALPDGKPILEIKNVDSLAFKDGWLVDGDDIEAPAHIELQVQNQLLVSRRSLAYIGALAGGNKVFLIARRPDEAVHAAIREKVAEFWRTIEANDPPAPNFERDAKFISKLMGYADPGKVLTEIPAQMDILMTQYGEFSQREKDAEHGKDAIKAEVLMLIGDAEKVKGDGWSISAGMIGPTLIKAYERKGYRDFRVYKKKEPKS